MFVRGVRGQFQLSATKPERVLERRANTALAVAVTWFTATGTVSHIVFGTLVFSSMIFVFTAEVLLIMFRFIVFAPVCIGRRIIRAQWD